MDAEVLDRGRAAFARYAWLDAFTALAAADARSPLDPADLERMGMAANLLMSNIFTKLDLSSRAAATAYAIQHGVV